MYSVEQFLKKIQNMQTQWICLRWLRAHNAARPNIGLEYRHNTLRTALFTGVNAPRMPNTLLKSVIFLNVDKILEPYKWLQCIQWTRYQQQGQKVSLE
ncbi:hypothetical protein TNCV_2971281 [Trichonephila clavipes]|nr:hypothetical protein TNCV_2971281 [Trichonephila clavipes]